MADHGYDNTGVLHDTMCFKNKDVSSSIMRATATFLTSTAATCIDWKCPETAHLSKNATAMAFCALLLLLLLLLSIQRPHLRMETVT